MILTKKLKTLPFFLGRRLSGACFSSNFYLNTQQHSQFLVSNAFSYNSELLPGHPLNVSLRNTQKTTVVVGGGVVGVSTALYLCQNTDDNVVLLEKLPEVAKETSNANGGIMGFEYNIIWVSKAISTHYWNSIIDRDYPFKFKLKALFEKHMWRWILNMFISIQNDKKNLDKIDNLAQLAGREFTALQKIIPGENYDITAKGLLSIYDTENDFDHKQDFYSKKLEKGFKVEEVPIKNLLIVEPILARSDENFAKAILWPGETNVETEKFTNSMLKYCQTTFKNRFHVLTNTEANGFAVNIEKDRTEFIGVSTNNGLLGFDRIVISAGLQSKDVLDQLNIPCLLAPVKGYTLSVPVKNTGNVNTIVSDEKKRMSFAQIGDFIRIAAFAEFAGRDKTIEEKRKRQITQNLEEKIGKFPEEGRNHWVGLRPVSPDDVPFIGRIKKFKNLYINAGHGSKGTTLALGSARVLMEIMNPKGKESLKHEDYEFERFY